jgi:hypothetical protein
VFLKNQRNRAWWFMPVIPDLKQKDSGFEPTSATKKVPGQLGLPNKTLSHEKQTKNSAEVTYVARNNICVGIKEEKRQIMYLSFLFQKYIFKLIHSNNIHVCDAV